MNSSTIVWFKDLKYFFKIFYKFWSVRFRISRKSWWNDSSITSVANGSEPNAYMDVVITITHMQRVMNLDHQSRQRKYHKNIHRSIIIPAIINQILFIIIVSNLPTLISLHVGYNLRVQSFILSAQTKHLLLTCYASILIT